MKSLTINFFPLEDGKVKAVVYRGTNAYLYEASGFSEADCLRTIANLHVFHTDAENFGEVLDQAISRRD